MTQEMRGDDAATRAGGSDAGVLLSDGQDRPQNYGPVAQSAGPAFCGRKRRKFTPAESEYIRRRMVEEGAKTADISREMGRQWKSVRTHAVDMGYVDGVPRQPSRKAQRMCINCRSQFSYNATAEDYRLCGDCRDRATRAWP